MSDIVVFVRSHKRYGDQIVAYPVLYQLKQWWPEKRLRVVSRFDVAHYYTSLPWVDEFVQARGIRAHLKCLSPETALSVSLHHSSESYGLINMVRRPMMRMGFRNRRLLDFAWTHHHTKDINEYIGLANLHMLATYRRFCPVTAAQRCFAEIAAHHVAHIAPAEIVLIPGGGSGAFKRWAWQRYVALANLLKGHLGESTRFTFVLGPDERAEAAHLTALTRSDFSIEFGRSVPELAAIMAGARLIVANDCGPSHIAQAVNVPYVGVFNAPNPEWFWKRPLARDVVPGNGINDINAITPDQVLRACIEVLDGMKACRASGDAAHGSPVLQDALTG